MTSRRNQPTMAAIFRTRPARVLPVAIYPRGLLMKPFKLIGLALGASLALSTTALAQDITIGVAGPMTGGESAFGRHMKNGAEQAVAGLNAAGGAPGRHPALATRHHAPLPPQPRS